MDLIQLMKNCFARIFKKKSKHVFFTKDFFRNEKYIIGDYTYGNPTILFNDSEANLNIGKFCSIADGVSIFLGGNHRTDWITTYPFNKVPQFFSEAKNIVGHPSTKGDVLIGNDVWLGRNVTILSGIHIGNGAVVATESVVTRHIGPYEIWGGNPARLIRKRFDDKTILILENIKWWDWDISKIKRNINVLCSDDLKILESNYAETN